MIHNVGLEIGEMNVGKRKIPVTVYNKVIFIWEHYDWNMQYHLTNNSTAQNDRMMTVQYKDIYNCVLDV